LVERIEWNAREHHRQTDDSAVVLGHEDRPGVLAATHMHLPQVLVGHVVSMTKTRIHLPLGVLQLGDARATR